MLRQRAAAGGGKDGAGDESPKVGRSHDVSWMVIKGNYFAMLRPACQPEPVARAAFLREIRNAISV
jgi:hypothetical protein